MAATAMASSGKTRFQALKGWLAATARLLVYLEHRLAPPIAGSAGPVARPSADLAAGLGLAVDEWERELAALEAGGLVAGGPAEGITLLRPDELAILGDRSSRSDVGPPKGEGAR